MKYWEAVFASGIYQDQETESCHLELPDNINPSSPIASTRIYYPPLRTNLAGNEGVRP